MANRSHIGAGRDRMPAVAPDKGSFPLDHFHECEEHAVRYNACLDKHQLMPKRCQKFQINYIECRMKNGLMKQEKVENLGFNEVNSFENEQQKKRELFKKLVEIDKLAERNIVRMRGGDKKYDNNLYQV